MDKVNEVTKDCFNALVQIRNLADDGFLAPEMLHARVKGFIDELFRSGQRAGIYERDLHDMAYAIVALADEVAMRKSGSIRDVWLSNPLQLQYFSENLAGEGFFFRLEQLLADPRRVPCGSTTCACCSGSRASMRSAAVSSSSPPCSAA